MLKKFLAGLLLLMLLLGACFAQTEEVLFDGECAMTEESFVERGCDYFSSADVALYLHVFGELPPNYLTKEEAWELGWDSSKGNLWEIGYGFCIGGNYFGNLEGLLPDEFGRTWYECDANYAGGFRGAERLVFSNDGLIFYTADHYESFEQLYEGWYDTDYLYEEDQYEQEGWWNWEW